MTTKTRMKKEPQQGMRRHKLLPVEIARKLPAIGAQAGEGLNSTVWLKLFCPYGRLTYYVLEASEEEDGDRLLFTYCVSALGPDCDEYGYSSFRELSETQVKLFGSVPVPALERDLHFKPMQLCDVLARTERS